MLNFVITALHNWKTSSAGFLAVATAVGHLITQYSTGSFDPNMAWLDVTAIFAGFGLIAAPDAAPVAVQVVPVTK